MNWFLWGMLIFCVICIGSSFIDMNRIKIAHYKLDSNKLLKDCRIVFISDLHNNLFGKNNKRLLNKIENLKPDYIIIGGDILTAKKNEKFKVATDFMNHITKKHTVYYGLGNHEYRAKIYEETYGDMYKDYFDSIQCSNLHVLDNKQVFLKKENIILSGLTLDRKYYQRIKVPQVDENEFSHVFEEINFNIFQILLVHNPEYFKSYDALGMDLTLAGHLHGGVIKIPWFRGLVSASLHFFPKYAGGIFKGKNGSIIISRGLGMHTIPIRVFNPCELVCIDLLKEEGLGGEYGISS